MTRIVPKTPRLALSLAALAMVGLASGAAAQPQAQTQRAPSPWQVTEADLVVPDFEFESGETLPKMNVHYSTLGKPRRDAQGNVINAIMLLHGTGGSGRGMASATFGNDMFGPGQPMDIAKYYIVMPDGIGHGGSSKPSDGLKASFPKYDYLDMVNAQRALAQHLGIRQFELIGGQSMGCMHSFVWGTVYPDAMKRLLPLACTPTEIAGRNRLYRKMMIEAVRADPGYMDGNYVAPPANGLRAANFILSFVTSTPATLQQRFPTRKAADDHVDQLMRTPPRQDANDLIWQFDASRNYDPEPLLGTIKAKLLWINSADDYVNPPEAGLIDKVKAKLKPDQFMMIPFGPDTVGHGTTMRPMFWKDRVAAFMRE